MASSWEERQPGESRRAYDAFLEYCTMGAGRSLRGLFRYYRTLEANIPPTRKWPTIASWSSKYEWVRRSTAWDEDERARRRQAHQRALEIMAQRQVEQGRSFQQVSAMIAEKMEGFIEILRPFTEESITEDGQIIRVSRTLMRPADVAALLRAAADMYKVGISAERLAMGEATERVDVIERVRVLAERLGLPADATKLAVAEVERMLRLGA